MDAKLAASGLVASDLDATPTPQGFRIPYYLPDGKPHPIMYRERLQNAVGDQKYTQPPANAFTDPSDATYPYLNPFVLGGATWEQVAGITPKRVLIVEGELKAACAGKLLQRPVIGIGGCANGTRHDERGVHFLHPVIQSLLRRGDMVEVVLDGDLLTNAQVNRAAGTLRRTLIRLGLSVAFVLLPSVAAGGAKTGFDDWAMALPASTVPALYEKLPRLTGAEDGGFLENLPSLWDYLGLDCGGPQSVPLRNEANLLRILDGHEHFLERYYFDQMSHCIIDRRNKAPIAFHDFSMREARWLQTHAGLRSATKDSAADMLQMIEFRPAFHVNELQDDIAAVPWDGEPRLETMFIKAFGADDNVMHRAFGRNWLVSAVARAFDPGCKVDSMLILEGRQGIGKTRAMEAIGGRWYCALDGSMENKDFLLSAHTGWIADVIELGAFRYDNFARIKGLITTSRDKIRAPYAREARELPRRFVLVGSTNTDDYLRDETGNRRFWPVACSGTINVPWLRNNRAQLLAEALYQYRAGAIWYDIPKDAVEALQAKRLEHDPWADAVQTILQDVARFRSIVYNGDPYLFVGTNEVLTYMGYSKKDMSTGIYKRISRTFKIYFPEWRSHQYMGQPITVAGELTPKARGYILPLTPRIKQAMTYNPSTQAGDGA